MSQQNFDPPIPPGAVGVMILGPKRVTSRRTTGPDGKPRIEITVEQDCRIKIDPARAIQFTLTVRRPKII